MRRRWRSFRYRLEWFGLRLATKLVPLLSHKMCRRVANFLGAAIAILDGHARKVALANLELAFGNEFSPNERQKIMRESFQHFARTMLELLWSARLNQQNWSGYLEFENLNQIKDSDGKPQNCIIACYHYSNFEWVSMAFAYGFLRGTIIAQEFKNSLLDPIFREIRERCGHELIPRERGIVRLYKALRRNGSTALLVDLTVPPSQGAVVIDCFGLKTSVTSAHAWLHQRTGVPLLPAHCEPLPDGRYRVVVHPKVDTTGMTLQQIAQACWDSFEPYLRQKPAPWLWMYKHWRYRPTGADRPYPFYAHIYEPFDEILQSSQGTEPADAARKLSS